MLDDFVQPSRTHEFYLTIGGSSPVSALRTPGLGSNTIHCGTKCSAGDGSDDQAGVSLWWVPSPHASHEIKTGHRQASRA
jgi:hypothetical protein